MRRGGVWGLRKMAESCVAELWGGKGVGLNGYVATNRRLGYESALLPHGGQCGEGGEFFSRFCGKRENAVWNFVAAPLDRVAEWEGKYRDGDVGGTEFIFNLPVWILPMGL